MSIENLKDAISFSQAAAIFPLSRTGRKVHSNNFRRWSTVGVRGVKLQAWRVAGRWMTTQAAIQEFLESLNATGNDPK